MNSTTQILNQKNFRELIVKRVDLREVVEDQNESLVVEVVEV